MGAILIIIERCSRVWQTYRHYKEQRGSTGTIDSCTLRIYVCMIIFVNAWPVKELPCSKLFLHIFRFVLAASSAFRRTFFLLLHRVREL